MYRSLTMSNSTVVADGVFPGPLISGFKGDNFRVSFECQRYIIPYLLAHYALQINVFDDLTDSDMRRSISIVNYAR